MCNIKHDWHTSSERSYSYHIYLKLRVQNLYDAFRAF